MKRNDYAATGKLVKVGFRTNRVITLLLLLLPPLFAYAAAASNLAILQTPEQLGTYIAENQGNALLGLIAANTIAGATVWRIRASTAIITSLLSVVLVVSNTRADEDLGRLELLLAGAVGPKAPLAAALIKGFGTNILGGLLMALGFLAAGFPAEGSFVAGLCTALCGCFFTGLAAIAAQVMPNARAARGLSFGAIAFFFLWQVAANITGTESLLLLTPFGWCAYARPYAGENWRLFAFAVPAVALLAGIAFILSGRRDLGESYVRERDGRAFARKGFGSPLALAWRQQRGLFFAWTAAYAVMGLLIASLAPSINQMLDGTAFLPELSAILGGAGNAFLAILSYLLTQVLTAYAILAILRMREEESTTRAELILSGAVSRLRYAAGDLLIAFAGSAVAIALFGLCTGETSACLARLPAVWLVASITVLAYGLAPRAAAPVGWGVFGAMLLLEFFWEIRVIGNRVFALSPFAWVYPGVKVSPVPLLIMLLAAALLTGLGLIAFSRRDLEAE